MKYSSSTGRWLRANAQKGKVAGKVLKSAISTLGLVGSLSLFKQLESALDPDNAEGKEFLGSLIQDLTVKMKDLKLKQNILSNSSYHSGGFGEYVWLMIGMVCLGLSCMLATMVKPCVIGYYR